MEDTKRIAPNMVFVFSGDKIPLSLISMLVLYYLKTNDSWIVLKYIFFNMQH